MEEKSIKLKLIVLCIMIDEEDNDIETLTPASEIKVQKVFQIIKID